MKKIFMLMMLVCFSLVAEKVFAADVQNVSNALQADLSNNLVADNSDMDEGYGSDEEYFGAEVNGIDDYINDEDLIVNAEEENIENEDDLDQVVNAVTK